MFKCTIIFLVVFLNSTEHSTYQNVSTLLVQRVRQVIHGSRVIIIITITMLMMTTIPMIKGMVHVASTFSQPTRRQGRKRCVGSDGGWVKQERTDVIMIRRTEPSDGVGVGGSSSSTTSTGTAATTRTVQGRRRRRLRDTRDMRMRWECDQRGLWV